MAHDLRMLLRLAAGREATPTAAVMDSRTLQSTPESGERAGYDGAKRRKGSKVHLAVDTLGHLLTLHVTAADEQDRAQVALLAQAVQEVTGDTVEVAFVDQGYTGKETADQAARHGIDLLVVKHTAGIPWRDLPERFGDFRVIHTRHTRWNKSGVWQRMFEALAADAHNEYAMIDSTIVRAH